MDLFTESTNMIIFNCDQEHISLKDFLYGENVSSRLFRKLYKSKHIYLNGKFARKDTELKIGDMVSIYMEDEENHIIPEKMCLDIVYEDNDLLIINKQDDMVVHPTKSHQVNTLSNGIAYHFIENGIHKKIRFVNRLDMDTTGILIVAKNPFAHQQMAIQLEDNTVIKRYYCLVDGVVEKNEGNIDEPIGREEERSIRKVVTDKGQDALTSYKVLKRFKDATLMDVQIFTGKSHQIRVHMKYIGHPIIGDSLYNKESLYIKRQALHSYYLKAKHPRRNIEIEFIAPLPDDMKNLIDLLKD